MPLARTHSVALVGVEGHVVEVEADVANGLPATVLVGLPDSALREARDRVRAAILNSGRDWPRRKITIGLSPANLPKRGSWFDLAIAVAVLAADGAVPLASPKGIAFVAELGLDGRLRPVPGVLPAAIAAAGHGIETIVVATENAAEAGLVPGVGVVAADTLAQIIDWLRGSPPPPPTPPGDEPPSGPVPGGLVKDMADIAGQAQARMALEVCAAGGHNLSLLGPRDSGKTMLAERLPTILPELDAEAAVEVTSIHSVAGRFPTGEGLITTPPFSAPHHTATKAAIVGGGSGLIRPGAASLAHRGVLFLDEAPEFNRDVLDSLRQPLEAGEVTIARLGMFATFPARFTLVLASKPCPCGRTDSRGSCDCSPVVRHRYLARLSGPLLDRIDVKVRVERPPADRHHQLGESSTVLAKRVSAARARATARLDGTPWRLNAEIPGSVLRRDFALPPSTMRDIDHAMELGQVSARGADKIVRVAWTIADLAGRPRPGIDDIRQALGLWIGVSDG
jgi:magnesium chelatase family protein